MKSKRTYWVLGGLLVWFALCGAVAIFISIKAVKKVIASEETTQLAFADVAYSPDGKMILAGGGELIEPKNKPIYMGQGSATILNPDLGDGVEALEDSFIKSVAISRDSQWCAWGLFNGTVRIVPFSNDKSLKQQEIDAHHGLVTSLAFSPDTKTLLTVGQGDPVIKAWDLRTGKLVWSKKIAVHAHINKLSFSPDGKMLAVAGFLTKKRSLLRVYDIPIRPEETGRSLDCSGDILYSAIFLRDSQTLACAGTAGIVRLWDAQTGRLKNGAFVHESHIISSLSQSPDGKKLAITMMRDEANEKSIPNLKVFDRSGKLLKKIVQNGGCHKTAFSPDGKKLAAVGMEKVQLYELK
jgi:WD40 repeat protein